jgi:folate-dependent phosphoribosylglycinamide formyltransferase PurN
MNSMKRRIVILAGDVPSTQTVVHALERDHEVVGVIVEDKEPRSLFLKRRAKRMGWWTVMGQVLFSVVIVTVENILWRKRIQEVFVEYGLVEGKITVPVTRVHSVNDTATIELLRSLQPDTVVLHGTRIVSDTVLCSIEASFINIHAGMTPMYRGVHGAYWALAEGHPELCGVTVHLVDPGIDTGKVLAQAVCVPKKGDCFVVYPHLQLGVGLGLLVDVFARSTLVPTPIAAPFSRLWYHPTIWRYLWTYVTKGVK